MLICHDDSKTDQSWDQADFMTFFAVDVKQMWQLLSKSGGF